MAQHFLLSAAARTLSLKSIFSEGEDAAYDRFRRLRWPETDGRRQMAGRFARHAAVSAYTT